MDFPASHVWWHRRVLAQWDAGRTCKQLEPGTDNKTVKVSLIFGFKVQPLPLENQGGIDVYWCVLIVSLYFSRFMTWWSEYSTILYWSFFRGWNHKPATGEYARVKAPPIFFDAENASHDAEGPLGPMRPPWMSGKFFRIPTPSGSRKWRGHARNLHLVLVFNCVRPKLKYFAISSISSSGDPHWEIMAKVWSFEPARGCWRMEIWFGTVLVLPWNLSALGPQGSQKGLDQHRNGLFETKRIDYFFQAEIVAHNHVHKCSLP